MLELQCAIFYLQNCKIVNSIHNEKKDETHINVICLTTVMMQGKLFQRCVQCIAVYCLWAVMSTQDGCQSLTWDPSFT